VNVIRKNLYLVLTKVDIIISNGLALKDLNTKTIDSLLQKADDALYESKNTGKNKVTFRLKKNSD